MSGLTNFSKDSQYGKFVPNRFEQGNIDLDNRTPVLDENGNIMTEYSQTVEGLGFNEWMNVPQVVNGELYSAEDSYMHAMLTNKHLGKFNGLNSAVDNANQIHLRQQNIYTGE